MPTPRTIRSAPSTSTGALPDVIGLRNAAATRAVTTASGKMPAATFDATTLGRDLITVGSMNPVRVNM